MGASLGVASAASGTLDADSLVRNADVAMYVAKHGGKGRLSVFERPSPSPPSSSLVCAAVVAVLMVWSARLCRGACQRGRVGGWWASAGSGPFVVEGAVEAFDLPFQRGV